MEANAFSKRSFLVRDRNRLEVARLAALQAGHVLLDLTESNPTRTELPSCETAIAALRHPDAQRYQPLPFGICSAREALSAWMAERGPIVAPEHIVLTASTSEAYAFLFKLLCDPGDDVLIPSPSYPLFEHLARLENVASVPYPLVYDGRWHLPAGVLRALTTPRTRAVVAVHPNNPTGSFLKREELAQIAALGLPIISDEVFAPYPLGHDIERARTAHDARQSLVFTLHGLSKLAGLPQMKLSWICVSGPQAQVDEACARLELIADSFLSVATPVQLALPAILQSHRARTEAITARIFQNLKTLNELTQGTSVSTLHVEGGWYATLRLPDIMDDEAWSIDFLSALQVLVQPGYFYDFAIGQYVVLSLLTPEAVLKTGARRIVERVDAVLCTRS